MIDRLRDTFWSLAILRLLRNSFPWKVIASQNTMIFLRISFLFSIQLCLTFNSFVVCQYKMHTWNISSAPISYVHPCRDRCAGNSRRKSSHAKRPAKQDILWVSIRLGTGCVNFNCSYTTWSVIFPIHRSLLLMISFFSIIFIWEVTNILPFLLSCDRRLLNVDLQD